VLVFTVYGEGDAQRFVVHRPAEDGKSVVDVTADYEVRTLTCEDDHGLVVGWHIGKREPKPPCAHISTTMFVDGLATCAGCGIRVDEHRNPCDETDGA
jgi:hypothetical protein